MDHLYGFLDTALGLSAEPRNLSLLQISVRALFVFVCALAMLRVAHKRFFARRNALDVLMTFILASTLARAINGSAPFFPTIAVGFLLVLVHRALGYAAARFPLLGYLIKGHSFVLVADGRVQDDMLRRHSLSREDLTEDLRLNGVASPDAVDRAVLERNGEVSVIRR